MSMYISGNDTWTPSYNDPAFAATVQKSRDEIAELDEKYTHKAETLEDIRDTKGKSYRTEDLVKLMEKYDPDAYAEYSKYGKTSDGAYSKAGLGVLSKWMDKVKQGFKDGTITSQGKGAGAADVSISSEGMKSYRNSMLQAEKDKLGNTDVVLTDHRLLISSKLPSDYGDPDENGEYHVISRSISERADNLLKAYAEAYDEIQKGYADGTRETYVRDENSEKGFRKLTKEEELAELDKAFEGLTQTFENRNSKKVIDALVANAEKIAKLVTDRPTMAAGNLPELRKRQEELSKLPENFGQSIANAAKTFGQLYDQTKPGTVDIAGLLGGISIFGGR